MIFEGQKLWQWFLFLLKGQCWRWFFIFLRWDVWQFPILFGKTTRPFTVAGLTPLGCAALVGDSSLVRLLLQASNALFESMIFPKGTRLNGGICYSVIVPWRRVLYVFSSGIQIYFVCGTVKKTSGDVATCVLRFSKKSCRQRLVVYGLVEKIHRFQIITLASSQQEWSSGGEKFWNKMTEKGHKNLCI